MESEESSEQLQPAASFNQLVDKYIPKPKKRFWHRRKKTPEPDIPDADRLFALISTDEANNLLQQVGNHPDGAHFFRKVYDQAYKDLPRKLRGKSEEERTKILTKSSEIVAHFLKDLDKHVQLSTQHAGIHPLHPRGLRRFFSINMGMGPQQYAKVVTEEIYMNAQSKTAEIQLKTLRHFPYLNVSNPAW